MPLDWSPSTPLLQTLGQISSAYLAAIWAIAPIVAAGIAALLFASRPPSRRWIANLPRGIAFAGAGLLLILALAWAGKFASLFDDAYISLRYAANMVRGDGLVFNPGERVEGYTNFLWTLSLALAMKLGFDGPRFALFGCLASFAGTLILVARISRTPGDPRELPWGSLVLGAGYLFASYGTSGMETMPAALLMTLALERALAGKLLQSGSAAIASVLAHPDHALLYASLALAMACDPTLRKQLWRYLLPFLFVYIPYYLARWHYYGDFFPNTYYAKSANLIWLSQGAIYLWASFLSSGLFALLPLAILGIWERPRSLLSIYAISSFTLLSLYIAKIGGDFMLGRLIIPLLPIFAILADLGFRTLLSRGKAAAWIAGAVLLSLAAAPVQLIEKDRVRWWLADEGSWYRVTKLWPEVETASHRLPRALGLRELAQSGLTPAPVIAEPMVGLEGYLSGLTIIDMLGLTDRTVAHQPLLKRGRPGHEKIATPEYLRSRGVSLAFQSFYRPPYADLSKIELHGVSFYLVEYQPQLIAALRSIPDARVQDIPAYIDEYLQAAAGQRPPSIESDAAFFEQFYFSVNSDPSRHARLQALR